MNNNVLITDYLWFQEGPGVRNTQYTSSGIKLLNVANFVDGNIDLTTSNRYISHEEAYGKYKHFLVDAGDFLIASSGIQVDYFEKKMGFIHIEQLPLCMNTSTIRFKNLKPNELDMRYFMYYLKSNAFKKQLARHIVGSAQLNFGPSHLKKMTFPIIGIERQRHLVEQFEKIYSLISLRKQQLAKLDELVKARFVELFGEWNSNPEPLKSFLKDITYGFTNPMPDAEEGPWKVTAKDVVNGKVNYDTARKTTVQAFEELTAKSKPTVGDVLMTKDGTLGRCAVVEEDGICVNQSVAVLKCNEKILPKFLAILLQMPEYQREMLKNAGGGTIKHIYITKVVDMLIVAPTISQQMEFLSFVEQTDKSKLTIQQSLDKLETLKKSLMQKYFG